MDMPRSLAADRGVGYLIHAETGSCASDRRTDPSGVAFAYRYGYIQALLDALAP